MNSYDKFLLNEIEAFLGFKIACSNYQANYNLSKGKGAYEYTLKIPNKCVDKALLDSVNSLKNHGKQQTLNSLFFETKIQLMNYDYNEEFLELKFDILIVEKLIECGKVDLELNIEKRVI